MKSDLLNSLITKAMLGRKNLFNMDMKSKKVKSFTLFILSLEEFFPKEKKEIPKLSA